ncbi:hypothetical protein DXZ20_07225 [Leptolyngbyaceae cyanobacterium CCMR0081]|uniref:Uncharacterized protein n=2 Tax=Adonisia TaxID=2950183 RepID=A0A6M0RIJ7_9CYAN|nr:hypothetical protein [Adonisia turfae CCMR0081]
MKIVQLQAENHDGEEVKIAMELTPDRKNFILTPDVEKPDEWLEIPVPCVLAAIQYLGIVPSSVTVEAVEEEK